MKAKYYIPPESQVTSEFVYDIMFGKKKVSILVIHLALGSETERCGYNARTSNSRSEDKSNLEESRRHTDIDAYMPDLKDGKLPNKDFVVNVGKDKFMHNVDSEQHFTRSNAENG